MIFPLLFLQAMYFVLRVQGTGGTFPHPLSAKQESECLQRYRNGDQTAREMLIEHNLRLVAHIVKKYYSDPSDQDDLISIGTIGLIKAVSTFDADKNTRLGTYAARCIENAILTLRSFLMIILNLVGFFLRSGTVFIVSVIILLLWLENVKKKFHMPPFILIPSLCLTPVR